MSSAQNLQKFFDDDRFSDEEIILLGLLGRRFGRPIGMNQMADGMDDPKDWFIDYLKQREEPVRDQQDSPVKPFADFLTIMAKDEGVALYLEQFDREKTPDADFKFAEIMARFANREMPDSGKSKIFQNIIAEMSGSERTSIAYMAYRVIQFAGKTLEGFVPKSSAEADLLNLG